MRSLVMTVKWASEKSLAFSEASYPVSEAKTAAVLRMRGKRMTLKAAGLNLGLD